jgi:acetoin utilization protein AcuB
MSRYQYVRDIMAKPVLTTTPDTALNVALGTMLQKRIHRLPVVDSSNPNKVVGIVTERNLRLAADSPFLEESAQEVLEHLAKHKVGEIMRSSVTTVTDDASIVEAAKMMRVSNVYVLPPHRITPVIDPYPPLPYPPFSGGVPVLDKQGQLVGIITRTDMIDHLIRVLEPLDEGQGQ